MPSGSGSTGGVILGEDEVVASKVYGEAGVLTGGKLSHVDGKITLSQENTYSFNRFKPALVTTGRGTFVIIDRKYTENIDNEIAIYNITENTFGHADYSSKFSYTYEELGLEGDVLCIAASPLHGYKGIVQFSIGTTVGIYTYYFSPDGNNGNGSIGEPTIYSSKQKFVINNPVSDYNAITYSNTNANVFAYYSNGKVYIVNIAWSIDEIINYTEVEVEIYGNNVMGLFRFSLSDRFLIFAPWGNHDKCEVGLMLLNDFFYVIHQSISEERETTGWHNGQLAISPDDSFAIINGKPYQLNYDLEAKTITYTQMSESEVIPYQDSANESLYACFAPEGNYIYALSSFKSNTNDMVPLATFKVDLMSLESTWQTVSNQLAIGHPRVRVVFDPLNKKVFRYVAGYNEAGLEPITTDAIGFYY